MTLSLLLVVMVTSPALGRRRGIVQFHEDVGTNHAQQLRFKPEHPDRGYVHNCGPRGGYYNISWYPKEISPADRVKFYAYVVSPVDLSDVHVVGAVWYEGTRMMVIDRKYSCWDLADNLSFVFPRDALRLQCPIHKGQLLSGYFLYTGTEVLIGYDGTFELNASVRDSKTGRELLCIDIKLNVLPFPDS